MSTQSLQQIHVRQVAVQRRQRVHLGGFLMAVAIVLAALVAM